MKVASLFMLALSLTGCATIVHNDRQQVFFRGGPEIGVTKVQSPDGTFEIENGSGSYLMTRSKSNIPLKITCPDGSTKNTLVETKFDWLLGGAGNLLNGGWGWLVDPFMSDAYVIDDVTLQPYCKAAAEKTAH